MKKSMAFLNLVFLHETDGEAEEAIENLMTYAENIGFRYATEEEVLQLRSAERIESVARARGAYRARLN